MPLGLRIRCSTDIAPPLSVTISRASASPNPTLPVRVEEGRLAICNVPRAFQGLPIRLMYIGLLALATYGLIGHQLPV